MENKISKIPLARQFSALLAFVKDNPNDNGKMNGKIKRSGKTGLSKRARKMIKSYRVNKTSTSHLNLGRPSNHDH